MTRKPGPDVNKIKKKIKKVLNKNPNGLWIREIARQSDLTKSTVSLYINKHMPDEVEEVFETDNQWIKIVRLKN